VPEQFATLFDGHYLPQGLALYRSLERQGDPFHLWILAMDEPCAAALERLKLPHASVLRLAEIEDTRLLAVKSSRSVGEYCWTLTPFLPEIVLARAPGLAQVTYLDADLFFFDRWSALLDEFAATGKDVLITDHAFAPEYLDRLRYGRYCVQFLTFRNTAAGLEVMRWWQDRCLEWCYARDEDGRFGDQKYLDDWPGLFPHAVHVLAQAERTVAPWNVAHLARRDGRANPVFYHFHSLRIVERSRILLYINYFIGRGNHWIYDRYVDALRQAARELRALGIPILTRPLPAERFRSVRYLGRRLAGTIAWADL
jgi:hypothetical protein